MVHALREAHRVLKPNGILIDLRPAPKHRRAGVGEGRRWKFIGEMREDLRFDYAADKAVAQVLRLGLFRRQHHVQFNLDRVMNTLDDLSAFIDEFAQLGQKLPPHGWLLRRLQSAWRPGLKITVRGPLMLTTLQKL